MFYVIKAAIHLHKEMVAESESYEPLVPGYKPKRPSPIPGVMTGGLSLAVLSYIMFITAFPANGNVGFNVAREDEVKIVFKYSPLWTPERKQRIVREISAFRLYLVGLGFQVPKTFPPLGIGPGEGWGGVLESRDTVYNDAYKIGEGSINIPLDIRQMYSSYVFPALVGEFDVHKDKNNRGHAGVVIANYFASSFMHDDWARIDRKSFSNPYTLWILALWDIRNRFGREFTDHALLFTVKKFDEVPAEESINDFNAYFYKKFSRGESVVDDIVPNGFARKHFPEIVKILSRDGIIVDRL